MNERIKELVVESGNGQMRNGKLYPHIGSRTEEDWKKFAELIINRIIDNVQCHGDLYDSPDIKFICENIVNSVKFDFGVEE